MKKIILVFDDINFSNASFEFARKLNEAEPILLTGIFLPQPYITSFWADAVTGVPLTAVTTSDERLVKQNIEKFEARCQATNIDYRVHNDQRNLVIPSLEYESKFADLLIIGSESFYGQFSNKERNIYLNEALHNIKCPAICLPEKDIFPDNLVIAYDGSDSSLLAIKQFACLFPAFCQFETVLVHVTDSNGDIPEIAQIEELAGRHFPNLTILNLQVQPLSMFTTWLTERKNAMLICGSFGRGGFSEIFKKSFVKELVAEHLLPVFIAHD